MSKSYGNYIGITEPAGEIYGKIMSISDELMMKYYALLSTAPHERIKSIREGKVHPKEAKEALAFEISSRFHGLDEAKSAQKAFSSLFKDKKTPDEIEEVAITVDEAEIWLPRLLVEMNLAGGTSVAIRLMAQGGVRLDGDKITDKKTRVPTDRGFLLQVGKRTFKRVSFKTKKH